MIVCDRCGKKIIYLDSKTNKSLTIYKAAGAYIGHNVDLCEECVHELEDYLGKAESYFMVEKENPSKIFDGVKYWNEKS